MSKSAVRPRQPRDRARANIAIVPGKSFSNSDIDSSVSVFVTTGYFSDVSINVSGGTLVVTVSENQLVNQVVFNGNRRIKDDKLQAVVRTVARPLQRSSSPRSDIQAIRMPMPASAAKM